MTRRALKGTLFAIALALFATPAFAQVQIAQVAANGSGCTSGSVSAVILGDQASVLFGQYNVTTTANRPVQVKTCNVAIGLRLPAQALTVAVTDVTWRGTVALERGSSAMFSRAFFATGQQSVNVNTMFTRAGLQSFELNDRVAGVGVTSCSARTAILRANTGLAVAGSGAAEVQSADIVTFAQIQLRLRVAGGCGR